MKRGFTLAEVLITLTIIGVIAAITIPNLMQSYKKREVEVKVKEAYSILSNAVKISETENGNINDWIYPNNETGQNSQVPAFFNVYLAPYLKISKTCKTWLDGCFPLNNGQQLVYHLNEEKYIYGAWYKSYILANGMSLALLCWTGSETSCFLMVDINGPAKGKSIIGNDVFFYTLKTSSVYEKEFFAPGYTEPYYNRNIINKNLTELLSTSVDGGCYNNSSGKGMIPGGSQCAAAIAKNGWKIPDDYPVKKW